MVGDQVTIAVVDTDERMRLDDLAQRAGVATTTVRLYQNKGLLPGPELVGRTGYYDRSHLERLRLIGRLQAQGFSLEGIRHLLDAWDRGEGLGELMGVAAEVDQLLRPGEPLTISVDELVQRFPDGSVTPDLMEKAVSLGLAQLTDDGLVRIPDRRFVDTGAALAELGIPVDVVLEEWTNLRQAVDEIARRFVAVFDQHVAPDGWQDGIDVDAAGLVSASLGQLRQTARQAVLAALDAALADLAADHLASIAAVTDGDRP